MRMFGPVRVAARTLDEPRPRSVARSRSGPRALPGRGPKPTTAHVSWVRSAGLASCWAAVWLTGCSGDFADHGQGAPATPTSLLGAWYGSGAAFPDGDLCIVLCENGRMFSGDRPCTDTTAGDFSTYLRYTYESGQVIVESATGTTSSVEVMQNGDQATFTFAGDGQTYVLPMARTAATSSLCSRTDVTWRGAS
jgi:hypothetical protein